MKKALVAATLALVLALGAPVAAFAAEAQAQAPMDVQVWPGADPGQLLVIVSVNISPDTPLPTTVRIPVVEGFQVTWAGEVAAVQQNDLQRQPQIKKGVGGEYAEFEVTTNRQAQVEFGSVPLSQTAEGQSATVRFVQTVPVDTTSFSVRVPADVSKVTIEPAPAGAPQRNQAGEQLYTLPSKQLAPGEATTVSVAYRLGQELVPVDQGPPAVPVVAILSFLIVVAAAVLVVVLRRSSGVAAGAPGASGEDESDEPRG